MEVYGVEAFDEGDADDTVDNFDVAQHNIDDLTKGDRRAFDDGVEHLIHVGWYFPKTMSGYKDNPDIF